MSVIEAFDLSKTYGADRGVRDLSFQVAQGEIFGYLGPNGSGKTTTIRLMLDFIRPSSGEIRLFGHPVSRSGKQARRRIGYLPGEIGFPENRRGESLLKLYANLSDSPAPLKDWACDVLQFSMKDRKRRVKAYSKGMKQKLAIVQALQHDPDLLILDEPTSGLDPIIQANFFDALRELKRRGKTIFFSSHILSEVYNLCDRIGVLREGRLVLDADAAHIIGNAGRLLWLRFSADDTVPAEVPAVANATFLRREGQWYVYQVAPGAFDRILPELNRIRPVDFRFESAIEDSFLSVYEDETVRSRRG